MKLKDILFQHSPDESLREIVVLLRPLPASVSPSEYFLAQTRLRLLQLENGRQSSTQRAA
jgi:hypothetical protein